MNFKLMNTNKLLPEQDKLIKIKLMNSSLSHPSNLRERSPNRQLSPKRQQWALINQYKALQYERLKQKERLLALQKKNSFRRQLDNQLNSKNNVQQQEIEADRKYYEFITQQANLLKQREERQKIERIIKRRQTEDENARNMELTKNSRIRDHDTGYHLQIGHKSEQERKRNSQNIKKTVMDSLDEQIRQKNQERERKYQMQRQKQLKNLQLQYSFFDKRPDPQKNFGQNERVYQYYQDLERQKRIKEMQMEFRLVEEAAHRKRIEEDQRLRNQQLKKHRIKEEVKQTLDQQVKEHNFKKFEESKVNPEDYSYGVISGVFKQRRSSIDKARYMEELRLQVEEQRKKKKMENYMSEEEYRLNMNQLNKIVNGEYVHNGYLDRSMGTIGETKHFRLADIKDRIGDEDAEVIKKRLNALRSSQNGSYSVSRTDSSF